MSREDWICILLIILGIILVLYGANYYNNLVGWFGIFLFLGGVLALILLYVYNSLAKHETEEALQSP